MIHNDLLVASCTNFTDAVAIFPRYAPTVLIRLILVATFLIARAGIALEFWVATNGSDANAGTRAAPFATFEHARDVVRRLKQNGLVPKGTTTIFLRRGDYIRTNAFELTAADSGTARHQ